MTRLVLGRPNLQALVVLGHNVIINSRISTIGHGGIGPICCGRLIETLIGIGAGGARHIVRVIVRLDRVQILAV